ncbi:TPA: hypothetical protein DCX16_01495 [bacterium]|nr:hypothetical protein [bacterium]
MRFFCSFFISCVINIILVFFLVGMGKGEKIKIHKAYKIDLVKLPEEKVIPKPKKEPRIQKPKEEPKPQEQQVLLPIEESPIVEEQEEVIPVVKKEPKEIPHIVVPVPYEEPRVYEVGSLDNPLKTISFVLPKYPSLAKKMEVEGRVKLKLLVNPNGEVDSIEVIEETPKGFGFREEALKAAKKYRFTKPTVFGKGVYVHYILPLRFLLEE